MSLINLRSRRTATAVQVRWSNWSAIVDLLGNDYLRQWPGAITDEYADPCGEPGPFIRLRNADGAVALHGDWLVRQAGKSGVTVLSTDQLVAAWERQGEEDVSHD